MTDSTFEIRSAHDRLAIEVTELTDEGTVFRCILEKGAFRSEVVANTYFVGRRALSLLLSLKSGAAGRVPRLGRTGTTL